MTNPDQSPEERNAEFKRQHIFSDDDLLRAARDLQDGDARLFREWYKDHFLFDHIAQRWHVWNAHHWYEDDRAEAIAALDAIVDQYEVAAKKAWWRANAATKDGKPDVAKREQAAANLHLKAVRRLQKLDWKRSVLTLAAAGTSGLGITGREWDQQPAVLACANGVVDLKTGTLRAGRQADYIKSISPTQWAGLDAECPIWDRFIREIFAGDEHIARYFQRLLGYATAAYWPVPEHILPILWGEGRNGKGTCLEVIRRVLGKSLAGSVSSEMLLQQRIPASSSSPSPEKMKLRGKRIVWASESDKGRRLNAGLVKLLTGGDTVSGRAPYAKEEVDWEPTHTLFLLTNFKPKVNADDYAIWQRIALIPFTMSFIDEPSKPHERLADKELPAKMAKEGPGILAWLVKGHLSWQEHGLCPPEAVKVATREYHHDEDGLGRFIDECCTVSPGSKLEVKASVFFKGYRAWCDDQGIRPMSQADVGKSIRRRYDSSMVRRLKSGVVYCGVDLIDGCRV